MNITRDQDTFKKVPGQKFLQVAAEPALNFTGKCVGSPRLLLAHAARTSPGELDGPAHTHAPPPFRPATGSAQSQLQADM